MSIAKSSARMPLLAPRSAAGGRASWGRIGSSPAPRRGWRTIERPPFRPALRPRLRLVVSNPDVAPASSPRIVALRLVASHGQRTFSPQSNEIAAFDGSTARRAGEYIFVIGLAAAGLAALVASLQQLLAR
jgi:hypothetical protein